MSGADSFLKPAKPLLLEMFKTRERHCPQIILWHSLTLSDLWSGNLSSLRGRFCLLQTENAVTIFRECMHGAKTASSETVGTRQENICQEREGI